MDVLCDEPDWTERFSRHPGNMHLQAMVRVQLEAYMACKSNDEEAEIVRLYHSIRYGAGAGFFEIIAGNGSMEAFVLK